MFFLIIKQKRIILFLIFLLIVGGISRFYNLGHIFLWEDEPLHQVRIAYQSLWFVLVHNYGTALSTLLAHFLLPLGKIEFMVRLGSAICGVLTICVIYLLGRAMFTRQEGLIAAVFATVSPFLIRISQYGRGYSIFTLLSLLSLYFFYKGTKEKNSRAWIFYSLFMVLAIYNHLVALLIVPALALYVGILWLQECLRQKIGPPRKSRQGLLARFALWTFLVLLLVILLYLPNIDVRDFLMSSLKRTVAPRENVSGSYFLINNILRNQIAPQTPVFYVLTLFFLGVGFVGSLRKYIQEIVLCGSYVIIPWLVFILINPKTTNLFSADRYFVFVLPVVLLLVARGIVVFDAFLRSIFLWRTFAQPLPHLLKKIPCCILVLAMTGGYAANFRPHYLLQWRFGSFKFDKEEMNFFRRHLKKDAVLHLDVFPLSSTIIIMSPLDKGIKQEDIEFIIRDGLKITKNESDFMVYQIEWPIFETFVASRNADLWMITELNDKSSGHLLSAVQARSGINVYFLKRHTILHFSNSDQSIAQKMAQMSEIFLSLPLEKFREKQFHWLAARANLMVDGIEKFSRQFQAAQGIKLEPQEIRAERLASIIKIGDQIFGLTPQCLFEIYQQQIFKGMQSLLFLFGNNLLTQGEIESAARAYGECLQVGDDFYTKIEQNLQTLALFKKILELNPERYDLRIFLGEACRKEGDLARAGAEYKEAFGMRALPADFFHLVKQVPQSLFIWEKDCRCFLTFVTQENAFFSGRIKATQKISGIEKFNFVGDDSLLSSKDRIRFQLNTKKEQVKLISFKIPDNSRLNFDLKVNGIRDPRKIILLPAGTQPSKIPFDKNVSSLK